MNSDIKPDFEKLAQEEYSDMTNGDNDYYTNRDMCVIEFIKISDQIWTDHVEPLLSTVKRLQEENEELKAKVKQQDKEYVLNGSVQEWKEYADRMNSKLGSLKSCINNVFAYESGMSEYFRMHDYRNMYELFNKMVAETRASLLKSELNKEEHGE